jgi:hypothetical protein
LKVAMNDEGIISADVHLEDATVTSRITIGSSTSWDEDAIPEAVVKKAKKIKESPRLNVKRGKPKGKVWAGSRRSRVSAASGGCRAWATSAWARS